MELRVSRFTSTSPRGSRSTPRLVEVWTRPGMSGLMASTPWGRASSSRISASASAPDMAWVGLAGFQGQVEARIEGAEGRAPVGLCSRQGRPEGLLLRGVQEDLAPRPRGGWRCACCRP